jgi:hypothetical protein
MAAKAERAKIRRMEILRSVVRGFDAPAWCE